jgi:N-dimethylarginine dimethylaminohydrolase
MSDAKNFSTDQPINPYYHPIPLDLSVANTEHETIHKLLLEAGIEVTQVDSPKDSQDGVYTANWALVRGNKAVLARLPCARTAEENYAEAVLTKLGKTIIRVPDNLRFSGQGDALACGDYLFCGKVYRSDEAAQEFAAQALGFKRIQLQTIPQLDAFKKPVVNLASGWPDSFFYDIDLALSIIKVPGDNQRGLIAFCPAAFTAESQATLAAMDEIDKIEVSIEEAEGAFANNLVSTGQTVIMSGRAPKLAASLIAHGLTVLSPNPDIIELAKGGGFIRCTTLTLD